MGRNGYMDGFDEKDSDDFEFSINPVIGVRGFRIDSLGRLTGWTFRSVWKSGENVAECALIRRSDECMEHSEKHKRVRDNYYNSRYTIEYNVPDQRIYNPADAAYYKIGKECYSEEPCTDIENCSHGFWAFFEDIDVDSISDQTYPAVIAGFGKTMIGTKGFRCEKAKIEAITLAPVKRNRIEKSTETTKVKPFSLYQTVPIAGLPITVFTYAICALADITSQWAQLAVLAGMFFTYLAFLTGYIFLRPIEITEEHSRVIEMPDEDNPHIVDIMRNYPEVRIYTNVKDMLADYPLVSNKPTDPNDPNFWTFDPEDEVIMRSKKSA